MTPVSAWCPRCGETKPAAQFPRNRSTRSGLATYCKPCHAEITRKNIKRLYGGGRQFHLKRRYGLSEQDVESMKLRQDGRCAICKVAEPSHVDHDHKTSQVRGLLCFNCNRALGYFEDDLERLAVAAVYLEGGAG